MTSSQPFVGSERACPACASRRGHVLPSIVIGGEPLARCARCSMVYCPYGWSEQAVEAHYRQLYSGASDAVHPITAKRYQAILERLGGRPGRLLEVGCGAGYFLKVAAQAGWTCHGTEVSESSLGIAPGPGIAEVYRGDLLRRQYDAGYFDAVAMFEVIEHLMDPASYLTECRRVLRPGGRLLVTTPNFNSANRRLLGQGWTDALFEGHVNYFTAATLSRVISAAGFRVLRADSKNFDPTNLLSRLHRRSADALEPQNRSTEPLRRSLEAHWWLRTAKSLANLCLDSTRLGDSLWLWAERAP